MFPENKILGGFVFFLGGGGDRWRVNFALSVRFG